MEKIQRPILFLLFLFPVLLNGQMSMSENTFGSCALGPVEVKNSRSINSAELEYSPVFYKNGIVYTATSDETTSYSKKGNMSNNYADLYFAEIDNRGGLKNTKPLVGSVNDKYHDGIATFNQTGDLMYFTRNYKKLTKKGALKLKICSATRKGDQWGNIKELSFNSKKYSTCHPTLSQDGTRMYFSSNRPGGFGGLDIYVSHMVEGVWQKPENLGPEINTNGNEMFPFIHANGELYFASNGHDGLGSLDIYKAYSEDSLTGWMILNMGAPINSPQDDFGFVMDEMMESGFFSSNRKGGMGSDDVYQWNRTVIQEPEIEVFSNYFPESDYEPVFEYQDKVMTIRDAKSGDVLSNATVLISEADVAGSVLKLKADEDGEVMFQWNGRSKYFFNVNKAGYVEYNKILMPTDLSTPDYSIALNEDPSYIEHPSYLPLEEKSSYTMDEIKSYNNRSFNSSPSLNPSEDLVHKGNSLEKHFLKEHQSFVAGQKITLENLYYDFNKYNLRAEAKKELDKVVELMHLYTSMVIELRSHTDSKGARFYNKFLSERRAESAVEYILAKGIGESRITSKGFGEERLLNDCFDGKPCSLVDHSKNRRTEILISEVGERNEIFTDNQTRGQKISSKMNNSHFLQFNPLYYEIGQANISPSFKKELNRVVEILKEYPSIKIEVNSYTDAKGNANNNLALSKKRAKSITRYLLKNGISSNRVFASGYGETRLSNNCGDGVNCSEAEHKMNRRTEIKVLRAEGSQFSQIK